jgi:putative transposase
MLTRTIDHYREETKETLVSACGLFGVNRQVYYRRKRSAQRKQETADKVVKMVIRVRQQMPRIGTRKLYYLLQDQLSDIGVGRDKLFSILKANHLLIKPTRSYRMTTDSRHHFRKHKNLIESLTPERPEQIWASDITYISNNGSHRYLALVTDTYSKKIVGYDLSTSLSADGAIRALNMGLRQRSFKEHKLIHHSDRGLQYCCDDYQKILARRQVQCSMTEKYDPYANAVAERVNGILKHEFLLEKYDVNLTVMQELVKNSVDIYNNNRPHYSCHMKTPEQMHKQTQIKIRSYKKTNRTRANLDTVS